MYPQFQLFPPRALPSPSAIVANRQIEIVQRIDRLRRSSIVVDGQIRERLLLIEYCELKSGVAAVLVTFTVPLP